MFFLGQQHMYSVNLAVLFPRLLFFPHTQWDVLGIRPCANIKVSLTLLTRQAGVC